MSTQWPKSQEETSLDLLQLCANIDGAAIHGRDVDAGRYLSDPSDAARHLTTGGIYTTVAPTLANGQASALRLTAAGKLMVDAVVNVGAVTIGDVPVGSTDGAAFNSPLRVDSAARLEGNIWGLDTSATANGPVTVSTEIINTVNHTFLSVGGSDTLGVSKVLPIGTNGIVTEAVVLGPTEILNDSDNLAGTVDGLVVDTRVASSGQCFSVVATGVVLGAGTITVNLEWGMSAVGPFYPFTGGAINIAGNVSDLIQFDFKAPYIRCSKVISIGVTSCTIVVTHFANGA